MADKEASVAIYCRLSLEDGDEKESNSIKTQKLIIESYCRRQGWTIFDTYVDDGFSGTNFERPGFQRMYKDIVNGKINIVITKDLSRLGRNYILTGYYYQVFFPEAEVRYIAVNDHIDTENENNDSPMAAFKNIINDLHSKNLGRSISAAKRARIENKINCKSKAPYGYVFNEEHTKLIPDSNYAPIVKFIFEEYVRNSNMAHISRKLDELGIPTSSERVHDREFLNGTSCTSWDGGRPFLLIEKPEYMGALTVAKKRKVSPYSNKLVRIPLADQTIIYDCHEPIVSRELWETVNAIHLEKKHKLQNKSPKKIFSGLLYCTHCGRSLGIHTYDSYFCSCQCWPVNTKGSRSLNLDVVCRRLVSDIRAIAAESEKDEIHAFSLISSCLARADQTQDIDFNLELYKIQKRIDNINDKINNIEKYCWGHVLSIIEKNTVLSALESSLSTETENLEKCKSTQNTIVSDEDIWLFIHKARRFGFIKEIDREVLEELIDKIYVSKKENSLPFQQDRITIKFKHIGVLSNASLI